MSWYPWHPKSTSRQCHPADPDGDSLAIESLTQPAHGQALNNGDGTVTFVPDDSVAVGQTATFTLSYTVSDGHGGAATATVSVNVTGVNDAPRPT